MAPTRQPAFSDVTDETGLVFTHQAFEDGSYYFPEQVGAGAALFDYDNDGDLDAYFVNGAPHGPTPLVRAGAAATNRLFRQDPGLKFVDVTDVAGVGDTGFGMGVAVGDYDNDGNVDLFVTNVGPDVLYLNNGDGTFSDHTAAAGVAGRGWGSSATFVDYDGDGFLDLYVAQYVVLDRNLVCADHHRQPEYCGPKQYTPEADVLYRNNGDGTFSDVSTVSGIAAAPSYGLGLAACDLTGDGRPDIFVANDQMPNQLWVNRGDGTFEDQAHLRGVAVTWEGHSHAGMGVAADDVDDDGDIDLFVTHLGSEYHTLYRNVKNESFTDDTTHSTRWLRGHTGWGTTFLDYDHDADLDLAFVNGRIARGNLLVRHRAPTYWDPYAEPNVLATNDGRGGFREFGNVEPLARVAENSRGLAWGDVDNDGDVDLLVTNCGGKARLYRNDRENSDVGGHWLLVRAIDPDLKRDAIGAVVSVTAANKTRHRLVAPGRSYLSSGDPRTHFGLGPVSHIDKIEVRWPNGSTETFAGGEADRIITLEKGRGGTVLPAPTTASSTSQVPALAASGTGADR